MEQMLLKGEKREQTEHMQSHRLTPLSGNVVQDSSVVAHRLSMRVSANVEWEEGEINGGRGGGKKKSTHDIKDHTQVPPSSIKDAGKTSSPSLL